MLKILNANIWKNCQNLLLQKKIPVRLYILGGDPTYLASPLMDSHVVSVPQNQADPSMNEQEETPSTNEHEISEPLATTTTSFVQPKSSHKWEKQLQQTLKDFRLDEIGKIGTRSSYKARLAAQSNVVDNIESIDELNLVSDLEPTSYIEAKDIEVWR